MNADRRHFLQLSAAGLTAAACTPTSANMNQRPASSPAASTTAATKAMPVVFVSHGAPTLALDRVAGRDFAALAAALPQPRAILAVSAHWLDAPPTLGSRTTRDLYYDFSGFPDELYRVRYAAPAAAGLADEVAQLLPDVARADDRPWDHGVWVPLVHMFPAADVPVLQLSMPWRWSPARMFELGRRLAPLRERGILVLASGGMVHNLGRLDWNGGANPAAWASNFEGWVRDRLQARAHDDLVAFRDKAPDLKLAHPTDDHFVPLLVAAGAGGDAAASVPID
ncbi:MAG: dioxygenase, partial [Planctomycetes bacterium]|nr:dioxygenase [Planctomycetota bacterium]